MNAQETPVFFREYDLNRARRMSSGRDPFPHQRTALDALQKWASSAPKLNAGGIVVLPTGGGKTFTAIRFLCSALISQRYKILWLAHTHHLLEQAFESFGDSLFKIVEPKATLAIRVVSGTIGHYPVHQIRPTDDVIVATLQTMTRAHEQSHPDLERFLNSAGNRLCVVFDEAHHAPAPSYRDLLKKLRASHAEMLLIGLTATPTYSDSKKQGWLKDLFPQGIIHQSPAKELLANEILAHPNFEKVPTEISPEFDDREYLRWVETYRDIPEHIIKALAENDVRNKAIAGHYLNNRERYGRTIIFAERWYQCERIEAILKDNGVRAGSVYSHIDASPANAEERNKRSSTENHKIIQQYKEGKLDVLINVKMLTEGTDVPLTQTVFITRQTTSGILLTQMVGRALRGPKAGGTKEAFIVSFEDNWKQKINWAEYDQLIDGLPLSDSDVKKTQSAPMVQISIDLLRRLVAQMDSTVNRTPAPFLKLMPIGWFRVEIQALVDGTDDIEEVRPLVMVFDDQQAGFNEFLAFLESADLSALTSERVMIDEVRATLEEWIARFFPGSEDMIGNIEIKDLFHLTRHVAQNEGERPRWFPFEDRRHYDLDVIAKRNIKDDLRHKEHQERLLAEYENPERYWKTLYPHYINFKTQYDGCVNRFDSPPESDSAPIVMAIPPALIEPIDEVKRQILSRDGHKCLCCGATKGAPKKCSLQVDHIRSRYMGGNHAIENLQTLCKECNRQKGTEFANFREHRHESRQEPPTSFPLLRVEANDEVGDADFWTRTLRRAINLYYGASAIESIKIGKKGQTFYDWSIRLLGENDARWMEPHLPRIVEEIRRIRSQAGFKGPDGIRILGIGNFEAAYFAKEEGEGSARLKGIPNGTNCRLTIDGKTYEGSILKGELKVGHNAPFTSFSAALLGLAGRPGNAWKAWELRRPNSSEWVRADLFRERLDTENSE